MTATITERGAPQRRRGALLEDAIRAAAYEELTEVGYTAFSVESVAARARTGKASIYRRWPTKADLVFDALCTELPTPQQCGLEDELPADISTVDALRQVGAKIAGIMQSPAGQVMRAIKCEALTDPDLARTIDERFQAPRRAAMLQLLRRGVERGEVRPDAVSAVVADILPAILTFRIIMQREPVSAAAIKEIVEQVLIPVIEAR
jgi:AcrR family transcriptional regulator